MLKNFVKELVEKYGGESNKRRNADKGTGDLRKVLIKHQEALEKIKAKYAQYSYEQNFKKEFGEELSFADFHAGYNVIADYCIRNNVSREKLYGLKQEIEVRREKIFDEISEKIKSAEAKTLKELAESKDFARKKTLIEAMREIKYNVNPYDQRVIHQENWLEEIDLDLIEEKLREKGTGNEIEPEEYSGNEKIKRGWDIVVEKLGRKSYKRKYPANYCQETRKMKENLLIFEKELREIKAEFEQDSFETACKEKFGAALDADDFLDKEKVDAFCEKNKIIHEELYRFCEERNKELRYGRLNKIQDKLSKKIELAEACVFLRDGHSFRGKQLKNLIRLIKKYCYSGEAAKFKEMVERVQVNKEELGIGEENTRKRMLTKMMNDIKFNIKPYGGEEKLPRDWGRKLDLIENDLREKGIVIEDYGQDQALERSWAEAEKQLKKPEKHDERILDDWYQKDRSGQATGAERVVLAPEKDGR